MVWYPTFDMIVETNKRAVSKDKYRHRLRRSTKAIQSLIDSVVNSESMGLTYQAARFMKGLVDLHAFDGGNHRTGYAIASLFLIENGVNVRTVSPSISYPFTKGIGAKTIEEVQEWIVKNMMKF